MILSGKATYQGVQCVEAEFSATPGLSPNRGFVVLATEPHSSFDFAEDAATFHDVVSFRPVTSIKTSPHNLAEIPTASPGSSGVKPYVPNGFKFDFFGDLVFTHELDSIEKSVTISRVIPVDLELVRESEDGVRLIRIELTDVRFVWADRGLLFADINHESPPVEEERWTFIPTNGFRERQNLRVIVDSVIAPRLPGVSGLTVWSAGAKSKAEDIFPRNISWRFNNPASELGKILKRYNLEVVLDRDGDTLLFYLPQEKGGQGDVIATLPPERKHIVEDPEYSFTPKTVLVVGAPKQRDVVANFHGGISPATGFEEREPERALIGLPLDEFGGEPVEGSDEIKWLGDVVGTYGLTLGELGRWIFQTPEKQVEILLDRIYGATPNSTSDFIDWSARARNRLASFAFRWFRIPNEYRRLLPVLDLKRDGKDFKPLIRADTFEEASLGSSDTKKSFRNISLAAIDPSKYSVERATGIIRFREKEFFIPGVLAPGFDRAESAEQLALRPGRMRIMFRSEDKGYRRDTLPDPYNITANDYFMLSAEMRGQQWGDPVFVTNPTRVTTSPRVISEPDLVYYEEITSYNHKTLTKEVKDNIVDVTNRAKEIAFRHFERRPVSKIVTGTLYGYEDLWVDGYIGQVTYRMSKSGASVEFVANSYRRSISSYASKTERDAISAIRESRRRMLQERVGVPMAQSLTTSVGPNAERER